MREIGILRGGAVLGAALMTVAFAGCSSDSAGEDNSPVGISDRPDDTAAIRRAFEPLIDEVCEWHFGCCTEGQLALSGLGAVKDAEECKERMIQSASEGSFYYSRADNPVSWTNRFFVYLGYDLDLGRVDINQEGLDECRAALKKRKCSAAPSTGDHCEPSVPQALTECEASNVLIGKQKQGQPCSSVSGGVECAKGLICSQTGQEGVCIPGAAEDSPCVEEYDCPDELVCDPESGTCQKGGQQGDDCEFYDADNPELGTEKTPCADAFLCDPRTNTCEPANCTWGTSCSTEKDCPEDLPCIMSQCREKSKLNQECYNDEHCAEGRCDSSYNICVPLAPNGVACQQASDCKSGVCDQGECAKPVAEGEPCASDQECEGYCDYNAPESVCVAYLDSGDTCTRDAECGPNSAAICLDEKCAQLPRELGESCANDYHCESERCSEDGECVERGAEGSACVLDFYGECQDGLFCKTAAGEVEGKCSVTKAPGEECQFNAECAGYNCRVVEGRKRCGTQTSAGEAMCDGLDEE